MNLLSLTDLVFVVDLTPTTMAQCQADFYPAAPPGAPTTNYPLRVPDHLEQPIRAMALLFDPHQDPVVLAISPTKDGQMLDAAARLIRAALLTGLSVADLVTEHGDNQLKRLFFAKGLPTFFYEGLPQAARDQVPPLLLRALNHPHQRGLLER